MKHASYFSLGLDFIYTPINVKNHRLGLGGGINLLDGNVTKAKAIDWQDGIYVHFEQISSFLLTPSVLLFYNYTFKSKFITGLKAVQYVDGEINPTFLLTFGVKL